MQPVAPKKDNGVRVSGDAVPQALGILHQMYSDSVKLESLVIAGIDPGQLKAIQGMGNKLKTSIISAINQLSGPQEESSISEM
jgi:hypothetical protein